MDRQTRSGVIRERETCAAEGEGRRQGHLRKTNVLEKKNYSNKETILCAILETYESVWHRVGERDLLMYRQVKD